MKVDLWHLIDQVLHHQCPMDEFIWCVAQADNDHVSAWGDVDGLIIAAMSIEIVCAIGVT